MFVRPSLTSPFTYVIVEAETHTRTCIHTPCEEDVTVADISQMTLNHAGKVHPFLEGVDLLYLGRRCLYFFAVVRFSCRIAILFSLYVCLFSPLSFFCLILLSYLPPSPSPPALLLPPPSCLLSSLSSLFICPPFPSISDSRHTDAAIHLATQARDTNIPVLLDCEKIRSEKGEDRKGEKGEKEEKGEERR